MTANPILIQKNIVVLLNVLQNYKDFHWMRHWIFYHSEVYQLIRDGVSDMHCMSDMYLAEELEQEYANKIENDTNGVKTN